MSKFQLEKGIEKAKFVLAKNNVGPNIRAQVAANLDVSGSARDLFRSGQMQEAFQRVVPIGVTFDDNGAIDVFMFADSEKIAHIDTCATQANYADYIKNSVLNNNAVADCLWGGTSYAPVIRRNLQDFGYYQTITKKGGLFSRGSSETVLSATGKSKDPVVVYFFTDGENDDKADTRKILQECQNAKCNIYFLFIGVGRGSNFDFLRKIGDEFGNTGFLSVADLAAFSDDDKIYDSLLPQELCSWLTK